MSKDDKRLKDTFNESASNIPPKQTENEKEEDKRIIAKKDNTNHKPKPPSFSLSSSAAIAPTGNMPVTPKDQEFEIEFIPDFDQDEPNIDLTLDNTLIDGKASNGIEFIIKQEDDPSSLGIDGGRISRLTLVQNDVPSAHFDKEWIIEPKTPLEIQVIDEIKEKFNDTPEIPFKGFNDPDPDNDHDI